MVTVTFVSAAAAPPPPPPPPPLGGGAVAPRHKAVARPKIEVAAKTPDLVQPKADPIVEPPREAPKEVAKETAKEQTTPGESGSAPGAGKAEGAKGGVANGVKGGEPGGSGTTPAPVAWLPPLMGAKQKISGAEPDFPTNLRTAGARYLVRAQICVGPSGAVDTVTLLKRAHPTLDNNVVTTVKTWRYRPLTANGTPVPFCYFLNHQFESE